MIINTNTQDKSIRPIKYGGTGKSTALEALLALGGIQIKKLWENASPSSNFAAQTVGLDLSKYSNVLLQYYVYHQDANGMHSIIVPVGDYGSMNIASSINRARVFQVLPTGVAFKDASKWTSYTSSSSTDNTWLTPYRIYGIEGVL